MTRVRVAVLASGQGTNLQALLEACAQPGAPAAVVQVLSDRADAGALTAARGAGVAMGVIHDPSDADQLIRLLDSAAVEMVLLAGYLKLVPAQAVRRFAGRMLNIHPALLPGFGGPGMYGIAVHRAVLASGARISGATVHLVDEVYDHGPILAQWPVPVRPDDAPETLAARVLAVEHQLLPVVVFAVARQLASGGTPVPLAPAGEAFGVAAAPRIALR